MSDEQQFPTLTEQPFAEQLRERRESAGLSQAEVARRAGLQRTTIRNLESGITAPAPATLRRLHRVKELNLADAGPEHAWAPHEHYAPTYSPLFLAERMTAALNAPGGALDQVFLYLDAQSAVDWKNYSNEAGYVANFRQKMPLAEVAELIAERAKSGIDVVALGAGDGKSETQLTQHLAERLPAPPDLRLYLLDISHALLHTAFRCAVDALASSRVPVYPIHGDFYDLPRYPVLAYRPPTDKRSRVWVFVGNTLGNLANEVHFFQDLQAVGRSGDFAVVHVQTAWASASNLDEVRAADPALSRSLSPLAERWLVGPVLRHCRGARSVTVTTEPMNHCAVPGSYEIQVYGTVHLDDGAARRYMLARIRRYDAGQLAAALAGVGWELVGDFPFGPLPHRCSVLLLRRV